MYEIKQDAAPIPQRSRKGNKAKYPFEALQPGQFFEVPRNDRLKVAGTLSYWGNKLNAKYAMRTHGLMVRVYCIERGPQSLEDLLS